MKNFRKLNQIEILVLTFFIAFAAIKTECIAGNNDQNNYGISVELLVPSTITIESQVQSIVILRKNAKVITFYRYGDPAKKIESMNINNLDLKNGKPIEIEGSLIGMDSSRINLLLENRIDDGILIQFGIIKENHDMGTILNITISQIKTIKAWRKGKPGQGALIGAGCGVGFAAIAAATNTQESQPGYLNFTPVQIFGASCIYTVPIGALVGALIGSAKKGKNFVINGSIISYNNMKNDLLHYQIRYNQNSSDSHQEIM